MGRDERLDAKSARSQRSLVVTGATQSAAPGHACWSSETPHDHSAMGRLQDRTREE